MTLDWSTATVLSTTEFDVAWDILDLGETPAALELPRPGTTDESREQAIRDALVTLTARGLSRYGHPVPDLAEELALCAHAGVVRDLVVTAPRRILAVAATEGSRTVLAVRLGDDVALARVPSTGAAAALVELLGPLTPGPGQPVRIPEIVLIEAMNACGGDQQRYRAELMRRGLSGADAGLLLRMGAVTGVGQLGVSVRTATGTGRRRAPYVLLVQTTEQGCYRQRRVPSRDAGTVVEAGPTDARSLIHELDALVAAPEQPVGSPR